MIVALAGFLAGLQHVVAGPDHLAAVAPLAVQDRRAAWRGGLSWAAGHAGGVGIIALIALALREVAPFDAAWISGWSERLVGIVLVGIGLWGFKRAFSRRLHTHVHDHGGERHVHIHLHPAGDAHEGAAPPAEAEAAHHHHTHAALAVGTLHGMAGGSHFLGVLPALALGTSPAVIYLAAYGAGTITAMVGFAWTVGLVANRAGAAGMQWTRGLMMLSSAAAVVVGVWWLGAGIHPPA
jgi:hypothetical protein